MDGPRPVIEFLQRYFFHYVAGIFALLAVASFYYHVSDYVWDESERRRLELAGLKLANIIRLMDAPDYAFATTSRQARLFLFQEYSRFLKEDVLSLMRLREMGMAAMAYAVLFLASYFVFRLKVRLSCTNNDLKFLTGLELILFRRLEGARQ